MTPTEIRNKLKPEDRERVLDHPYPKAYCHDLNNVKAILLGCDPSNNHNKHLPYVFALESGDKKFNSFLKSWESSLEAIDLRFEMVYIQNLCRNYFEHETSQNKIWKEVAELWIPELKKELAVLDPEIPILLTSELLYEVLLKNPDEKVRAIDFYEMNMPIPIKSADNKLGRPLIPFYRHYKYQIDKVEWKPYRKRVQMIIDDL
jgi:hypothetical protein